MTQEPDSKPGYYYATMRDGSKTALLAGPFHNDHAAALAIASRAHEAAVAVRPEYHFCSYGTVRSDIDLGPGKLNQVLGVN